jgi:hypothetical protein
MKVAELIAALNRFDQSADVFVVAHVATTDGGRDNLREFQIEQVSDGPPREAPTVGLLFVDEVEQDEVRT